MKLRFFNLSMLGLIITFGACTNAPDSDEAEVVEPGTVSEADASAVSYTVNSESSVVEWIGTKTTGRHNGTVNIKEGEMSVENGHITAGKFVMDMSTIKAYNKEDRKELNAKLTKHLKSEDFFDIATYPTATFEITRVEPATEAIPEETEDTHEIDKYRITNPTHMVSGNLNMHGVTKEITFPAKVNISENQVEAMAKFNINRKIWDIKYEILGEAILSNTIHLGINLMADRQAM